MSQERVRGLRAGLGPFGNEVLDELRMLVVAGIPIGVLVVGVGSRLAMLLLRLTSPDSVHGVISDDGFVIGRVTLSGTYNLLMLGAFVGIMGAAAYQWVAPFLLGPRWFRRATVALASGAVVGSMLVHADGIDFRLLKPTWLAIGLFVALPAVFGIAIGVAVDRVADPESWMNRGRFGRILPVALLVFFPGSLIALVPALVITPLWVVLRGEPGIDKLRNWRPGLLVARVAWLAIAVTGLFALIRDVQEII